jgi:hypothetical protein
MSAQKTCEKRVDLKQNDVLIEDLNHFSFQRTTRKLIEDMTGIEHLVHQVSNIWGLWR